MDHAPAPSWLDGHLDARPGWADSPADGVVIDPTDRSIEPLLDEAAAPAGESWLGDATIDGLDDALDELVEVTADDLDDSGAGDEEFAIPTTLAGEPGLVDPFDEFVAASEADAGAAAPPDALPGHSAPDDIHDAGGDGIGDIAPALGDEARPASDDPGDADADAVEAMAVFDAPDVPDATTGYDAFESDHGDAVAEGIGTADEPFTPGPSDDVDAAGDTGYDAFDDLDGGTDG